MRVFLKHVLCLWIRQGPGLGAQLADSNKYVTNKQIHSKEQRTYDLINVLIT